MRDMFVTAKGAADVDVRLGIPDTATLQYTTTLSSDNVETATGNLRLTLKDDMPSTNPNGNIYIISEQGERTLNVNEPQLGLGKLIITEAEQPRIRGEFMIVGRSRTISVNIIILPWAAYITTSNSNHIGLYRMSMTSTTDGKKRFYIKLTEPLDDVKLKTYLTELPKNQDFIDINYDFVARSKEQVAANEVKLQELNVKIESDNNALVQAELFASKQ